MQASHGLTVGLGLFVAALALSLLLMPRAINWLRRLGAGKQIQAELSASHQAKAGTPSMGGLIFSGIVVVLGALALHGRDDGMVTVLVALTLATAVLGAYDDLLSSARYRRGGMKARPKLAWQAGIAAGAVLSAWLGPGLPAQHIPGQGSLDLPWLVAPLAVLAIMGTGHAVNLTDGLDGLAGGTSLIAYGTFALIAYAQGQVVLGALCLLVMGAVSGFLWYNIHPARLFMGDCGSLALGSLLGGVALATGQIVALIPIGGVFVAEALSVIIQVAYFRRSNGKRIFRMSPLHHHFGLLGWPETQVVQRFWLAGFVCALVGIVMAL